MSASAILKLQSVGFTVDQVSALADFMDTQAASKIDLLETKSELKAEIAAIRADMKATEVRLEAKIETTVSSAKVDIVKWLFGTIVAQTGLLIAAFKLLH